MKRLIGSVYILKQSMQVNYMMLRGVASIVGNNLSFHLLRIKVLMLAE